jgi:peptide-methionine (S)-S-oxide reductase
MSDQTEQCVLGGGCFWCLEAAYQMVKGVESVISGYAGGQLDDPHYMQIETGLTGHAQVVELSFNPRVITYRDILDVFWVIHDPTQKDRQGYDVGPQYRSIILYTNDEQGHIAEESKAKIQKLWDKPVLTEIKPLVKFYRAEEYEQNYYRNHPEVAYCQVVINPKLAHLREKRASLLKSESK